MLRDGLDANPHVPRGRMTASTRAINLKDKRLHFLLIPSSTRYFGISFLIVALTRPWNYLFETEGGQSCAGINCENCHSFMTVALFGAKQTCQISSWRALSRKLLRHMQNLTKKEPLGDEGVNHSQHALESISLHIQEPAQEGWTLPVHSVPILGQAKEQSSPSLSGTKVSAAFKILYWHSSCRWPLQKEGQGLVFSTVDDTMASGEIKNLLICSSTFELLHRKEYYRQQGSKRVT